MHKTKLLPLAIACFISMSTFAQEGGSSGSTTNRSNTSKAATPVQGSLNSGNINSQFEYIFNSSNNFQEYKVVRKTSLEKLQANVADSIKTLKENLNEINKSIGENNENLVTVQDSLSSTKLALEKALIQQESFSFLGMQLTKTTYNGMVWGLIAVLFIIFIVFFYQYRKSNKVTVETKKSYTDLQEEYEKHRKRAMEREQRLNRQLQDELNKRL